MLTSRSLVSMALGLLVAVGTAAAESPKPPDAKAKPARARVGKIPYRLVTLMPDTGEALVYDRDRNAHVVVAEGDRLGSFSVSEIDEDHVVLSRDGRDVILAVDPAAPRPAPPVAKDGDDPADGHALIDPYQEAPDPYGATPHEVLAPPDQRASLQGAAVVDPYADANDPKAGKDARAGKDTRADGPPAAKPEVKVVPAPAAAKPITPTPAPAPAEDLTIRKDLLPIQRRELEAALSDFAKLGTEVGFTRVEHGVRLGKIAGGSYFYALGLRPGDVVTAIDGKALHGLDDAAAAYARLGTAKLLAIEVERASARGTLRFQLR